MKLKTIADISVTATPAASSLPDVDGVYTFLNADTANSVYVIHDPDTIPAGDTTTFAGLAAALAALGGVEIKAGQAIVVRGVPWFHAVCATTLTATLQVLAGALTGVTNLEANLGNVGLLNAAEAEIDPATLATQLGTIGDAMTSVAVDLDAGAAQELVSAPGADHQLWVYGYELHANVAGTYQFLDDTPAAQTGIMPVGANGGMAVMSPYPIFKCATNKALDITAVTSAVDGVVQYRDVDVS